MSCESRFPTQFAESDTDAFSGGGSISIPRRFLDDAVGQGLFVDYLEFRIAGDWTRSAGTFSGRDMPRIISNLNVAGLGCGTLFEAGGLELREETLKYVKSYGDTADSSATATGTIRVVLPFRDRRLISPNEGAIPAAWINRDFSGSFSAADIYGNGNITVNTATTLQVIAALSRPQDPTAPIYRRRYYQELATTTRKQSFAVNARVRYACLYTPTATGGFTDYTGDGTFAQVSSSALGVTAMRPSDLLLRHSYDDVESTANVEAGTSGFIGNGVCLYSAGDRRQLGEMPSVGELDLTFDANVPAGTRVYLEVFEDRSEKATSVAIGGHPRAGETKRKGAVVGPTGAVAAASVSASKRRVLPVTMVQAA